MPRLELKNISYKPKEKKLFGKPDREFDLSRISLEISPKKVSAVVGESGSGKTTLAKLIAGLIKPDKGEIKNDFKRNGKVSPVQILFQNSSELINPYRSVDDYLKYPSNNFEEIKKYTDLLEIKEELFRQRTGDLSGGERQRVALARILLAKPELLILDEPFSAQDPGSQKNIKNMLNRIKSEFDISMLIISHDIKILEQLADDIYVIHNGRIIESGKYDDVTGFPLHPYTKFLLEASEFNLNKERLVSVILPEETECKYYGSCPIRIDKCKTELTEIDKNNHLVLCNKPGEF